MSLLEALSPEELARQLRDPVGPSGLAVAEALGALNREGNVGIVARLALSPADQVLEVGCGLGGMAGVIVDSAKDVCYTGLDQSRTMIDAAADRHLDLIRTGRASFHLGQVEQMPFEAGRFTKVFSVGVIHFWPDPVVALTELRRTMRTGALMVMGGLGPERAPAFATQENGFYLHNAGDWRTFCEAAGLSAVEVGNTGPEDRPQVVYLTARA